MTSCVGAPESEQRGPIYASFSVADSNKSAELVRHKPPTTKTVCSVASLCNERFKELCSDRSIDENENVRLISSRLVSSSCVISLISDAGNLEGSFKDATEHDIFRWRMLAVCLSAGDVVGAKALWLGILKPSNNQTTYRGSSCAVPTETINTLFVDKSRTEIFDVFNLVLCKCRSPKLGRLLLDGLGDESVAQTHSTRRDLTSLIIAISDAVFGTDRNSKKTHEEKHAIWNDTFGPAATHRQGFPDRATDLTEWKSVICALLRIVGDALPERILVTLPRHRRYTLGLLQFAVRCASEHDTFLLDTLLEHKSWSASSLMEACAEALNVHHGIRGPNLQIVLPLLYAKQLISWRSNDALQSITPVDELAKHWSIVISCTDGRLRFDVDSKNALYLSSNSNYPNDRVEWMAIVQKMVDQHEYDARDPKAHEWDHSSPLFGSIIRIALEGCLGDDKKTHLVEYLVELSLSLQNANPSAMDWHKITNVVKTVALHHTDVTP